VTEPSDALSVVRWQFRLTWRLAADVHLPRLTDELCLWQPHPSSWTVHERSDGTWVADWADEDPPDPAPPSVGWLTWHVIWWWSETRAAVRGEPLADRESVHWPGTAARTVARLHELAESWTDELATAEVDRAVAYPWPDKRPVIYTLAWVNSELMKNVAEIGEVLNAASNRTDG
jgi:hypothetical protein